MNADYCKTRMKRKILCLLLCVSLGISMEAGFVRAGDFTSDGRRTNAAPAHCIDAKSDTETPGKDSYPFCSGNNLYTRKGKQIEQRTLDGTLLCSYKVKYLKELWWVDNGWIYYSVLPSGNSAEELWRVPFSQADGTDRILWDGKEKLLKDRYISALCISGSYVVYRGNRTYYRYDLQQKTSLALACKGRQKYILRTEFISTLPNVPLVKDGFVFLGDPHYVHHFYCLDIENWKIQKIPKHKLYYDRLVASEHAFFYVSGHNIWKYDPATNQSALFADKKSINKIVQDSNPSAAHKKVKWDIYGIFGDYDKVYIQIYSYWMQKEQAKGKAKAGSESKQDHYRMVILSLQQDTPSTLCYEKGLSECLKEKSKTIYLRHFDCTAESGEIWNIVDGNCILLLYAEGKEKRKTMREGCYSIKTGSFKYITKKDREYYYPDYIGANQGHDCPMGYE